MTKISLYPSVTLPLRAGDLFDVSENTGVGVYVTKRVQLSALAPNLANSIGGYSNIVSGLSSTTIQGAIDEVDGLLGTLSTLVSTLPTVNLYTGDGTLTAARTISGTGFPLVLNNSRFEVAGTDNSSATFGFTLKNLAGSTLMRVTNNGLVEQGNFGSGFSYAIQSAATGGLFVTGTSAQGILVDTNSSVACINVNNSLSGGFAYRSAVGNNFFNGTSGYSGFGTINSAYKLSLEVNEGRDGLWIRNNQSITNKNAFIIESNNGTLNRAVYLDAQGGTNNTTIETANGNNYFNAASGKSGFGFGGFGTLNGRLNVKEINSSTPIAQFQDAAGNIVFEVKYDGTDYGVYLNGTQVL